MFPGVARAATISALFCLPLAGCVGEKPKLAEQSLSIALAAQPVMALVHVAEERGYFREEGLAVSISNFDLGRDALAAAMAGETDLATVFDFPVVTKLSEGEDLAILTTLHRSSQSHALLARKDRGITRPADLSGKTIGVTQGISTGYFLEVFLASEGIPPPAVKQVHLDPADYETALRRGSVDALVTFNPHTFKLRELLGAENSLLFLTDLYLETSLLVGRRDRLEAKREAVTRALRALVRAEEFVHTQPEESLRLVAQRLREKFPEPVVRAGWGAFRAEARLDNLLLTQLMQQGHWLRERKGRQNALPDFERALAPEPLSAARPRAVTVLLHRR